MSNTVEERVGRFSAELDFKNQGFERKVEQSLGTLAKLKEALNFKGYEASFDEVAKAADNVHLDKISAGVDDLTRRFSTLGIVGMTNIMDLTRYIRSHLLGAVNTVTNKIVEGGKRRAMNVEQARFLLQGLIDNSSEIEEIMDNAMESVRDTAYGYDQAAMAAAQFATSGVKGGEQMLKALSGVAGVAATTNSEYSSISEIFTQVAGKGRLMGDELLQLSSRGLNAAAIIAKYFNNVQNGSVEATDSVKKSIQELSKGLEVSEGDIRDWTSKGKINFDIFSNAMSETFGKHAKDANKTLTGVLSNVNARFSQIGEKFVTPLIQQEGPLVSFFNTIKDKLAEVRDNVDPLAKLFDGVVIRGLSELEKRIKSIPVVDFFKSFNEGVSTLTSALSPSSVITKDIIEGLGLNENQLSALGKTIRAVAREHGIAIDDMIAADGKFLDTLKHGWLTFDIFKEAIDRVFGTEETEETVKNINEVREAALATIRGDYGNGAERIAKLTEAGFDPQAVQDYVDKIHEAAGGTWNYTEAMLDAIDAENGSVEALTKLSDKQLKAKGYTDDQIKGMRELAKAAKETGTPLNELLENAKDPFFGVKLIIESATNVLSNFGKIAGIVKGAFTEVFPPVLSTQITAFLVKVNAFSKSLKLSDEQSDKLSRTFKGLFSIVKIVLDFVVAKLGAWGPVILRIASGVFNAILSITATLGDFATEISKAVTESELFTKMFSLVSLVLNKIVDIGGKVASVVGGVAGKFAAFISKGQYLSKIINFLSGVLGKILDHFTNIQKTASAGIKVPGLDKVIESFTKLKNVLDEKIIGPAIDKITKFFSGKNIKLPKMDGFTGLLGKLAGAAGNGLSAVLDKITEAVSKVDFEKITKSVSDFIEKVKTNYAIPVFDKLVEVIGKIQSHLPSLEQVSQFLTNLFNIGMNEYIGPLVDTLGNLFKLFADNVGAPVLEEIGKFLSDLLENGPSLDSFVQLIQDLYNIVTSNLSIPAFDEIMDFISFISGYIYDFSASINILQWILDGLAAITNFSFFQKLADGLAKFTDVWIAPWLYKFFDFMNALYYAENLSGFIQNVNEAADGVERFSSASASGSGFPGFKRLQEVFEKIKQLLTEKWVDTYNNFIKSAKEYWNSPGLEKVRTAFEKIKTAVQNLDPETVYMWISRFSGLLTALVIRNTVKKLGDAFGGVAKAWEGVGEAFKGIAGSFSKIGDTISGGITKVTDSLAGVIDTYKSSIKTNIFLKIAVSLLIIAGALLVISRIPSDKIETVIAIVTTVSLCLAVLYATVAVFNQFGDMKGAGASILSFALAMVIIGFAIEKIAKLSPDQLIDGGSVIAATLIVLAVAMRFMDGLKFNASAVAMPIAFALSIGVLATIMAGVGALMIKFQGMIERGFLAVIGLMAIMSYCLVAINGISFSPAALAAPIAFAGAMLVLALEIVLFAFIPEEWFRVATERMAMIGAALLFASFVLGISGISPSEALTPLALTAALLLIAGDIVLFGLITQLPIFWTGLGAVFATLTIIAAASGLMAAIAKDSRMSIGAVLAPLTLVSGVAILAAAIAGIGIASKYGDINLGFQVVMFTLVGVLLATLFVSKAFEGMTIPIGAIVTSIELAVVVGLLALAIVGIGKLAKPDDIREGCNALIVAAVALILVAGAFGAVDFNASMVVGPILFTLALVVLMSAIVMIGVAPWDVIERGLVACLGAAFGLWMIAAAFGSVKIEPNAIAVMVLYILTIGLLVEAIMRIGSMNPDQAIQGVAGIAVTLIALSVAIGVLGAVAPQLDMIAASFIKLAAGFVVVGLAVVVASVGFAIIAFALQQVKDIDPATIAVTILSVAAAIGIMGLAAGVGALPLLAVGGAFILVGAGALLLAAALAIVTGTIPAICDGIKKLGESFKELGQNIAEGAANGIIGGAASFVGGVAGMAKAGFDAFCDFFAMRSPSKLMAAMSLFIPIGAGAGIDAGASIPAQSMTDMSNGMLGNFMTSMFGEGGIESLSAGIPGAAASGVESASGEGTTGIDTFTQQLKDRYTTDMFADSFWSDTSGQIGTETAAGIEQNSGEATGAMEKLNSLMEGKFDASEMSKYIESGELVPENIGIGVNNGSGELTTSYDDMLSQLGLDGMDFASSDSVVGIGEEWDTSQITGMLNRSEEVSDNAREVAEDAADAAGDTEDKWYDVGEDLVEGLADGIRANASRAINAAVDVAIDAYNAAKSALDINSPSKLFAKLGEGIDEGFILGMERMSGNVSDTSEGVAFSIVSSAKKPLDQLADLMSGDIVDDPTITPVLDLSEIQNGANRLYSMLGDADRISFSGNVDLANAASLSVSRDQQRKRESDNQMMGSLIDAINGLSALIGNTGNVYNVNGVTYDDGSNVSTAVRSLIRAAKIEGRA